MLSVVQKTTLSSIVNAILWGWEVRNRLKACRVFSDCQSWQTFNGNIFQQSQDNRDKNKVLNLKVNIFSF